MKNVNKISKKIVDIIYDYLHSDGPGGQKIVKAFMDEFEELSNRSPDNDPTNLKNHMDFIRNHVERTLDDSLSIDESGKITMGICKDEVLGFDEDKDKLKHRPTPVVWTVYLIRGIAGRYAFVDPNMYFIKHGQPMPGIYADGFLISMGTWYKEGWDVAVGPFELYEHPASGAPPVPFFRNVLKKIDLRSLINQALKDMEAEIIHAND